MEDLVKQVKSAYVNALGAHLSDEAALKVATILVDQENVEVPLPKGFALSLNWPYRTWSISRKISNSELESIIEAELEKG